MPHHKITHPAAIKVGNIVMTVVAFGAQREKQSLFRKTQRAAIREYPPDISVGISYAPCPDERYYLLYAILHFILFFM